MDKINISDICDKLEEISCTFGRIDELHNAVQQKYLLTGVDYNDTTSDGQLRIRDLCITYPTYTLKVPNVDEFSVENKLISTCGKVLNNVHNSVHF